MEKQLKVAYILDDYKVAINAGSDFGIKVGQRYLLYSLSNEEIIDPDTHKSLGFLEIVKGTGKVTNVQEHLCTIESDGYESSSKIITRKPSYPKGFSWISDSVEETEKSQQHIPYDNPCVGDLVKRIN